MNHFTPEFLAASWPSPKGQTTQPPTDEQRSLAWCPEPPHESTGGSDCRVGGSCGLDFSGESRRSQWVRARFRMRRERAA